MARSTRSGDGSLGLHEVWQKLVYPHWYWLPIALAGEIIAYAGYTLAYREVAPALPSSPRIHGPVSTTM